MILFLPLIIIIGLSLLIVLHVFPSSEAAWTIVFICALVAAGGGVVVTSGSWTWPWQHRPPNA